jgi:hypothetical protein
MVARDKPSPVEWTKSTNLGGQPATRPFNVRGGAMVDFVHLTGF